MPVPTGYSPQHVRSEPVTVVPRDRIFARQHADRWDHQLARGSAPESSAPLTLHAQVLVSAATRRGLASSLTRIVEDAEGRGVPDWNALGPRHHHAHVAPARGEIAVLIGLLLAPVPVSARGVALVRILLTDGGSPLYRRSAPQDLRTEIRKATRALDPTANWTI